jgi:hypothetical protein
MRAVTSKLCLEPTDPSCNMCGLLALPWPAPHFTGNFFTAQCQYVKKLIPPKAFIPAMNEVIAKAVYQRTIHWRFVANLLPDTPWHFGTDRYSSEQWIGSHPSVHICDLSQTANVTYWQMGDRPSSELNFAMFPRRPVKWAWSYTGSRRPNFAKTMKFPSFRLREWYLLAGSVFKWYELYNEAPPPSSWVWKWYPDGDVWLMAVQTYGHEALKFMTQEFAHESGIPLIDLGITPGGGEPDESVVDDDIAMKNQSIVSY